MAQTRPPTAHSATLRTAEARAPGKRMGRNVRDEVLILRFRFLVLQDHRAFDLAICYQRGKWLLSIIHPHLQTSHLSWCQIEFATHANELPCIIKPERIVAKATFFIVQLSRFTGTVVFNKKDNEILDVTDNCANADEIFNTWRSVFNTLYLKLTARSQYIAQASKAICVKWWCLDPSRHPAHDKEIHGPAQAVLRRKFHSQIRIHLNGLLT